MRKVCFLWKKWNFTTSSKKAEFHFYKGCMEIGISEVVKCSVKKKD